MMDMNKRDFRIVAGKGFALDLPNGVTVSVQWGPGNYCDSDVKNADFDAPGKTAAASEFWGSDLAECAAYRTDGGEWVAVPGFTGPLSYEDGEFYDDVVGYLNVSQVLDFIRRAAAVLVLVEEDPVSSDQHPLLPGQQELDFDDA